MRSIFAVRRQNPGKTEPRKESSRRESLNHVIALDERHLLRPSLEKGTPHKRAIEPKPGSDGERDLSAAPR